MQSLGYRTATFASAEDFLQSSYSHETTCLISDVQMPGMTGIELQGRLIAQGHHVPIIFVTAFPEVRTRGRALAAGAIGFLDKPFNDHKLIACLQEALSARPS